LSSDIIKTKGRDFAQRLGISNTNLMFSNGWLDSFQHRNGFKCWKLHGKSRDAEMEGINKQMTIIRSKIIEYDHDDVYNIDETGLVYNIAPNIIIAAR
jgi:Tc5 transposase DNA-binding domain